MFLFERFILVLFSGDFFKKIYYFFPQCMHRYYRYLIQIYTIGISHFKYTSTCGDSGVDGEERGPSSYTILSLTSSLVKTYTLNIHSTFQEKHFFFKSFSPPPLQIFFTLTIDLYLNYQFEFVFFLT